MKINVIQKVSLLGFLLIFASVSSQAQVQEGIGTYYHDKYHGQETASGEIYNKNDFTAAHKQLSFGTTVKVTRLDNRSIVYVKINDRGPFTPGRIIDLSKAAAAQLGMLRSGEVRVRIEVVQNEQGSEDVFVEDLSAPEPRANPNRDLSSLPLVDHNGRSINDNRREDFYEEEEDEEGEEEEYYEEDFEDESTVEMDPDVAKHTPQLFQMIAYKKEAAGYGVQVGAFFNFYRLLEALHELSGKGVQNSMVQSSSKEGGPMFRIIVGPFATKAEANAARKRLTSKKYKGITVNLAELN